jgi:broad specificity phosphatase PhoE
MTATQNTPSFRPGMRTFVLARHGHSQSNDTGLLNGDPGRAVGLTRRGEQQADLLREQLRRITVDLAVVTRFPRTRQTAERALAGRDVPCLVDPGLDEVDVGRLDGHPIQHYRDWKLTHRLDRRFPAGESLVDAVGRYVRALRRLADRDEQTTLVVAHQLPLRYLLDAACGRVELDNSPRGVPYATPFLLDERALRAAVGRLDALCRRVAA